MDMSAENPFADLMTKAVKLKGAQQAQLRTQFDSWPQHFQHSLFMQESVVSVRSKTFPERIAAAEAMKAAGNDHFNSEAFEEAVAEYEKALAVFKYLENKDPGWKKKGIEDTDMIVINFQCSDPEDQKRLDILKISCYLNIAGRWTKGFFFQGYYDLLHLFDVVVAKFKLKEFPVCIRACDDCLELDPNNVKAYYRRAQALITPASSGALEFDRAIADLQRAYAVDSENREVRKLLRELMEQRTRQRALDKETFSGMFNRGHVYDETEAAQDAQVDEAAREQKFQQEVEEAEALARGFEAKGKAEYAKEIRDKISQAQEVRSRRLKCVDFFNPTPEMIANAKESGIDLTDQNIQQMLHDLQEEERNKSSSSPETQPESKQSSPSAVDSVDSLLKSMSNTEIAQLLSREGIDYHKISDREQFLETAKHVLLSKLDKQKEAEKPSYARTIVFLAVAWTLLRLYTSGGLSALSRIATSALTGSPDTGVDQATKVMDIFDED
ncbi:Peptidyl-prolyl cis-trans isomerase D [Phytophthora citrophthora]|uniref:Peptidyl-prolyl cis-trans isomerase D n=1 Tax=Phytophthora citrophthora TaxID=4793 RepID=A0AAD9H1S3_9STRA|nr:Peptidyl-prolyl cis-trans isomerase D [Phytophthora citrophthora]